MDETEFLNRRLGQTLCGKWTLERLLGWGGMAAVYVGVHKIGRREAIKILHEEVAISPETRARFEQEAYAVNHLGHPGAVEVRDIDVTDEGCPFLVMELLEGQSLASMLQGNPELPIPVMLQYVDEVLDVLIAAHANGIVHRDIKPDNLFICASGRVKVLDFGVARMKEGAPRTLATRTGMAVGTLTYMAPEQVRGVHVDGRADVFAVGATMFRCITRRRIHDGKTDADLLIKMATLPAPAVRSVAPDTAEDLALVVDRALAFDAASRYPDAATMQRDVRALMRGERPPYATATGSTKASPTVSAVAPAAISPTDDATRAEVPAAMAAASVASPMARGATTPMTDASAEPPVSGPVAPTVVDGVTAGEPPRKAVSRGPVMLLLVGAAVLLVGVIVVVAVGGYWLFVAGAESENGTASSERTDLPTEVPAEPGDTSAATGVPTSTRLAPPTTTGPVPTTVKTPPAATPPATTPTAVVPTTTVPPAVTPPALTVPPIPTVPPAATTTDPPKDKKKDKDKGGKGKGKGKGKDK